jgi:hypothetical protein
MERLFYFFKNILQVVASDITTTTTSNEIVTGMSITPSFEGKYKVSFNYYNVILMNALFSSGKLKLIYRQFTIIYNHCGNSGNSWCCFGNGEVLSAGIYSIASYINGRDTLF